MGKILSTLLVESVPFNQKNESPRRGRNVHAGIERHEPGARLRQVPEARTRSGPVPVDEHQSLSTPHEVPRPDVVVDDQVLGVGNDAEVPNCITRRNETFGRIVELSNEGSNDNQIRTWPGRTAY